MAGAASDVPRLSLAERGSDATPLQIAVWLASRQRGVVARRQLLAAGVSAAAIDRLLASGVLVRLHVGVYAIGHAALRRDAVWRAAVLAGGEGAVLSHRSAAEAWNLRPDARRAVDITVRNRTGFGQAGLTPHQCRLAAEDVTVLDGIPITTVSRTLLDLAEVLPYRALHRAAEESLHLRLFDARAIRATLDRAPGRRGQRPLRRFLAEAVDEPEIKRSTLERIGVDLARRHGLPRPRVNAALLGKEADLLWARERVVAELDGWQGHGHRLAFERDRARDAALQAAGYAVLRFTWRQVVDDPATVADRIRAVLAARVASGPR